MYGNPYFNQQAYQQDLINMRDRIDKQIQQAQQAQLNNNQIPAINQTFQLSPNQGNHIKYAESEEDVSKELVFADTLFVNRAYTKMWLKNASGDIKEYELKEVVKIDEKDAQIASLMAKIEELEREMKKDESTRYDNANVNGAITNKKPSSSTNDKPSKK